MFAARCEGRTSREGRYEQLLFTVRALPVFTGGVVINLDYISLVYKGMELARKITLASWL